MAVKYAFGSVPYCLFESCPPKWCGTRRVRAYGNWSATLYQDNVDVFEK